ncbi:MAG: phosphoenolpyruvate carboxykinase, partial [Candidatus Omnitrophica bacterium]|nr:phosphoenolpyruvate carboxykinase [Candidatus Omnitrophota bacterium]
PKYEDLKVIFKELMKKEFTKEDYEKQFTLRIPENLAKIERIEHIYKTKVPDTPSMLYKFLDAQKQRLLETREKFGDYVSPALFEEVN